MKNWTIGKRLVSGFSVLVLVIVCFGAVTWLQMKNISGNLTLITKTGVPGLQAADALAYHVALLRIVNFKHLLYSAEKKAGLDKEAQEEETDIGKLLAEMDRLSTTAEQRALFSKIPPLWSAYQAETKKLREASTQNNMEAANAFLLSAGKIGNSLIQATEECQSYSSKQVDDGGKKIESTVSSAQWAIAIISLSAVVIGMFIALFITKGIGRILSRLVGELNTGAEQTTSAAGQVSSASQTLAEGASEQAASLEETSSSLEEMASMTKRNSENAQKANDLAKQARAAADKGAGDMQSMSSAMEAIKVSSDDIAKIIKTIDEIAFQTNILALNAAVEAARAGEAGMGFAVVADEVRNLAQRSAQAAKETAAKIEGAITKTGQGVEISTKVGQALNDIVAKVRQVDELVAEVSGASREQTQGITQINMAVGQMDKVTQSNAASAEESAAAAEELNAQAETMKQSVLELLKLVGGGNHAAAVQTQAPVRMKEVHTTRQASKLPVAVRGNGHAHKASAAASTGNTKEPAMAGASSLPLPDDSDFKDF